MIGKITILSFAIFLLITPVFQVIAIMQKEKNSEMISFVEKNMEEENKSEEGENSKTKTEENFYVENSSCRLYPKIMELKFAFGKFYLFIKSSLYAKLNTPPPDIFFC